MSDTITATEVKIRGILMGLNVPLGKLRRISQVINERQKEVSNFTKKLQAERDTLKSQLERRKAEVEALKENLGAGAKIEDYLRECMNNARNERDSLREQLKDALSRTINPPVICDPNKLPPDYGKLKDDARERQKQVDEILDYCHSYRHLMWAAVISGILLRCDFRDTTVLLIDRAKAQQGAEW